MLWRWFSKNKGADENECLLERFLSQHKTPDDQFYFVRLKKKKGFYVPL